MRRYACLPALVLVALSHPAYAQDASPPASPAAAPSMSEAAAAAPAPAPLPAPGPEAAPPPPDAAAPAAAADTTAPPPPEGDPLEGFNRAMWALNRGLDQAILKPVAVVYRTVTPRPARRGLSRVLANLTEPFSAINSLLQGKPDRAFNSLGRFVINSTIGVGGLADHATGFGLKPTPEDFGQTLAVWGVRSSAYLVIPILGPSTIRDGIGSAVGQFADPVNVCVAASWCIDATRTQQLAYTGVKIVSARADLMDAGADALLDSSADPYATARSAYLQRRAALIADADAASTGSGGGAGSSDAAVDAALKEIDDGAPPVPAPSQDTPTPASPK